MSRKRTRTRAETSPIARGVNWLVEKGLALLLILATIFGAISSAKIDRLSDTIGKSATEIRVELDSIRGTLIELNQSLATVLNDLESLVEARVDHEGH